MTANSMTNIEATEVAAPPAWALMERNLIALMEESGRLCARQYFECGGGTLFTDKTLIIALIGGIQRYVA